MNWIIDLTFCVITFGCIVGISLAKKDARFIAQSRNKVLTTIVIVLTTLFAWPTRLYLGK